MWRWNSYLGDAWRHLIAALWGRAQKVLEGREKSESGSCRLRDGSLSPETGRQYRTGWGRGGGTGQVTPKDFLLWVPGGPALRQKHKRKRGDG